MMTNTFTVIVVCLTQWVLCAQAAILTEFGTFVTARSELGGDKVAINETNPVTALMYVAGYVPYDGPNETLGCQPYSVSNQFLNRIALIERGQCNFVDKVRNAQNAGAVAVVVFDRSFNLSLTIMSGDDDEDIRIPSVFVSRDSGLILRTRYLSTFNETGIGLNLTINSVQPEGRNFGTRRDYYALGIMFGVFMGLSVVFWISFFAWRRYHTIRRGEALKKLKRMKYSPQETPSVAAAQPGPDIISASAAGVTPTWDPSIADSSTLASMEGGPPADNIVEMISIVSNEDTAPKVVKTFEARGEVDLERQANGEEEDQTEKERLAAAKALAIKRRSSVKPPLPPKPTVANRLRNLNPLRKNRTKWGPVDANRPIFDTGSCAVCLDEFQPGEEVMILPCRHIFHPDCVSEWLLSHGQCPVCKSNVVKCEQRPGEEYPRTGLGLLFGAALSQTIIMWFIWLCFFVILGYFLTMTGFLS